MTFSSVDAEEDEEDETKAILIERDLTWNKYQKDDNSYMMEIYSGPVNYQDETNQWYPIDITFKSNNGMLYIDTAPYRLEISADKSSYRIYPDRNINDKYIDFYMPDLKVNDESFYEFTCDVDDYSVEWDFNNFAIDLESASNGIFFYYTLKDKTADHSIDMQIIPHNCEIDNDGNIEGFDNCKIVNIVHDSNDIPNSFVPDYTYNQETNILSITIDDTDDLVYPLILDPSLEYYSSDDDRYLMGSNADYDVVHNSTTSAMVIDIRNYVGQDYLYSSGWKYHLYRSYIYFNTSSLPDNAILESGNLGLYGTSDYSTTDFSIVIQYNVTKARPTKPIVTADYNHVYYEGDLGSISTSGWQSGFPYTRNIIVLNSSGLDSVNKEGISKYCLRSDRDINYNHPTGNEYVTYFNGRFTGTSYDPKLIINYTTPSTWWDDDWSYRKNLTINNSYVDSNLTNFPVLVYLSSDSNLSNNAQSDGDDIVFADSTHSIKYNHEIELYNNTTGKLVAWVNVTSLSSTEDTVLYMYYGNSDCSSQENSTDVWDSNYKAIYHFSESTGSTVYDSTNNDNDGTYNGTLPDLTTSDIGGQDFNDGSDFITFPIGAHVDISGTHECYVKPDDNNAINELLSVYDVDGSHRREMEIRHHDNKHYMHVKGAGSWYDYPVLAVPTTETYYALSYENGAQSWYMDDDEKGTGSVSTEVWAGANVCTRRYIGCNCAETYNFDGKMYEWRISNTKRSDDWLETTYNTISSPSTFITIGSEESN